MTPEEYIRYFDARSVAAALGKPGEHLIKDLSVAVVAIEALDRSYDYRNMSAEAIAAMDEERAAEVRVAEFVTAEINREHARPGRIAETQDQRAMLASPDAEERNAGFGLIDARYAVWLDGYRERMVEWVNG